MLFRSLGHGQGYLFPHDYPHNVVAQQYLPEEIRGTRYYQPTTNGHEAAVSQTLAAIEQLNSQE